ncbi:hypothetical protein ACFFJY_17325 [Fictibacillus aquaticus]|nr:hypothetical protein [Fictibacillus aquaticus]
MEVFSCQAPIEAEIYKESLQEISGLDEFIQSHKKPSFRDVLFSYIDQSGATDAAIYTKAGIDRRHFSKIRSRADYTPKKNTVIALALSLKLDIDNTDELLSSAGYSLSQSDEADLVIQYFIEKQNYNIHVIDEALYRFKGKTLVGAI